MAERTQHEEETKKGGEKEREEKKKGGEKKEEKKKGGEKKEEKKKGGEKKCITGDRTQDLLHGRLEAPGN